ncbi:MAG: hypothetical protein PHW74_07255 [Desulfobacca sp.]|nr:hypothetical protein [Desulfobacca sp.]
MEKPLGTEMHQATFVAQGAFPLPIYEDILEGLVNTIGMQIPPGETGQPITKVFPAEDGSGGNGVTVVQFLVESFAVIDAWDDLDHFFVIINSCRPFDCRVAGDYLQTKGHILDFAQSRVRNPDIP